MDHSGKISVKLRGSSESQAENGEDPGAMLARRSGTAALLALSAGLAMIFYHVGREPNLKTHVPEFTALMLFAGVMYLVAVYTAWHARPDRWALFIIVSAALVFRALLLPATPQLSDDIYRYQWEGRIQRAHINPYTVYPAMRELQRFQDPSHRIQAAEYTPAIYPPLTEKTFTWLETIADYKRLFTALDVASLGLLLLILAAVKQPTQHVIAYAWNPTAVMSFALCGHLDSLAIFMLLAASLLIITRRPVFSGALLALSVLSKFFAIVLVPLFYTLIDEKSPGSAGMVDATPARRGHPFFGADFLSRCRLFFISAFLGTLVAGYAPYLTAGKRVMQGLGNYAAAWEANDSIFRLVRGAGNSQAQAELVIAIIFLSLVFYVLKRRSQFFRGRLPAGSLWSDSSRLFMMQASLILTAGLLLLSPDAFPWYFTWSIPFLCFYPSAPWLLMTVLCILGYAPVVAYAAGQPYIHSPFILALEYGPVLGWVAWSGVQEIGRSRDRSTGTTAV